MEAQDGMPAGRFSRRRLLALLGAGGGLVATGAVVAAVREGYLRDVPGALTVARVTGACGGEVPPGAEPGPLVDGVLDSRRRGRPVGFTIAYPPGSAPGDALPVCLVLHGRGGNERTVFDWLRFHRHLAAHVAGHPEERFALVSADGDDRYWHPRADGDDPLGMVLDELLPELGARGLVIDRFGVHGWSMGGFGALLVATTVPGRVVAVSASAPAVWPSYDQFRPSAFDSREDWERHDPFRRTEAFADMPVRVDCGDLDPFLPGARRLAGALPGTVERDFGPGCHNGTYWQQQAPAQLAFLGAALVRG